MKKILQILFGKVYTHDEVKKLLRGQRYACSESLCCMTGPLLARQKRKVINAPEPIQFREEDK